VIEMSDKPLEQSIFLMALELATPAEREACLRRACGNNEALRAAVAELLAAHERADNILDAPPVAVGTVAQADSGAGSLEQPGTVFGPYKLIEPIGEGGMGTVWMAQQTEPVKRLVAIKLIKAGMDSKQVLARFAVERQALALMDHSNIARVLDAGTSSAGRPYFVMDLVKGVPITRYCDEHRLTPRQRMELFIPVCRAVQHAHQKGVIHRDLKPSNVLVASYDGRPVPKVIDFGVAKATGQALTDKTLVTGFGNIVGTLEYMSPEQAEINQLDIDTRSDIYSLGVLLYELLTGSPPFSRKELEKAGMLEMLRVIREKEPSKPSTKLSSSDALPTLSANRGTEAAKLTKLVKGELDWIVMKALEKDRNRRYETANAFAMDVQRYLADEPVQAGPPSRWYRLRKFMRRNKGPVLATAALLVMLLAGIVGTTAGLIQAMRAEEQATTDRDEKQASLTRLKEEQGKLKKEQGRTAAALVKARQSAQQTRRALRSLTEQFVDKFLFGRERPSPEDQDYLRGVLAQYEAFAAAQGDDPETRALRAEGYLQVGLLQMRLKELPAARETYLKAIPLLEGLAAESSEPLAHRLDLAVCHNCLGVVLFHLGERHGGEKEIRQALTLIRQLERDFPQDTRARRALLGSLGELGVTLVGSGDRGSAEALFREALALGEGWVDAHSEPALKVELAVAYHNWGHSLCAAQQAEEGEAAYRKAIGILEELAGRFPKEHQYRLKLATTYGNLGTATKASADVRKHVEIMREMVAEHPGNPWYRTILGIGLRNLAGALTMEGKHQEAAEVERQGVSLRRQLVEDYPKAPEHRRDLAISLLNASHSPESNKRPKEALQLLDEALQVLAPVPSDSPEARSLLGRIHERRAVTLLDVAGYSESVAALDQAIKFSSGTKQCDLRLMRAETLTYINPAKAVAEAEALLTEAPAPAAKSGRIDCMVGVVCAMASARDTDEARREQFARRAVALFRQAGEKGHFNNPAYRRELSATPKFRQLIQRADFKAFLAELDGKRP
jgi:serine/threonine protein kinase/tetratricopeptide (TPR) repeat protein